MPSSKTSSANAPNDRRETRDPNDGAEPPQLTDLHDQRACFTVHNFIHQGIADEQFLWATGLCNPTRLRDNLDPAKLNLLKGGIVYSNFVTTVSPTHAWEVSYSDLGRGLGHTLHVHKYKSAGVLDGVDYDVWNPEVDPWIARAYGPDSLEDKYVNKGALRDRFFLRHDSLSSVAPANRPSSNRSL